MSDERKEQQLTLAEFVRATREAFAGDAPEWQDGDDYQYSIFKTRAQWLELCDAIDARNLRVDSQQNVGPDFNTESNLHADTVAERFDAAPSPAGQRRALGAAQNVAPTETPWLWKTRMDFTDAVEYSHYLEQEIVKVQAAVRDTKRWQWAMKHPGLFEQIVILAGNEIGDWAVIITNKVDAALARRNDHE